MNSSTSTCVTVVLEIIIVDVNFPSFLIDISNYRGLIFIYVTQFFMACFLFIWFFFFLRNLCPGASVLYRKIKQVPTEIYASHSKINSSWKCVFCFNELFSQENEAAPATPPNLLPDNLTKSYHDELLGFVSAVFPDSLQTSLQREYLHCLFLSFKISNLLPSSVSNPRSKKFVLWLRYHMQMTQIIKKYYISGVSTFFII